eukprot:scaffold41994_cov328-Skeletonema_dohrnii-CCMP3373.AAC.1
MAANDIWLAGCYRSVVVCHCDIQPLAAIRQTRKEKEGGKRSGWVNDRARAVQGRWCSQQITCGEQSSL